MVDVLAVRLPRIAEPGQVLYTPDEIETRIGGHPIDVAIDLVELGHPPDQVAVVAAVGEGPYGTFVRSEINRRGLTTFLQSVPDRDTGKNIVLEVSGEDRRFHLDPGANWVLDLRHVASALHDWAPDVVTLRPGYSGIDLELDTLLAPLDGTLIMLDIMEPHPSRPAGFLEPALRRAAIVHCNEIEARVATGRDTVEAAIADFFAQGVELVLITSGGSGATAYTPSHTVRQPGFDVDVVDVTGCGDAFCAGILHRLGELGPAALDRSTSTELSSLLLVGQAVGASAATRVGCVEGVSAELVDRIIREQGESILADTEVIENESG